MISSKQIACLLLLLLFFSTQTHAQRRAQLRLFLKNRTLTLPDSIPDRIVPAQARQHQVGQQRSLVIVQFNKIPDEATRSRLLAEGITLLDYVPDHAYTAVVSGAPSGKALKHLGVRAIYKPGPEDIVQPALLAGAVPAHARNAAGKMDVRLSFAKPFPNNDVVRDLNQAGFEVIYDGLKAYQVIDVRIPEDGVRRLAAFPWVQYIVPVAEPSAMLNDRSVAGTKANVLGSGALLGYKLAGEGVVIGLGDDSNPMHHPDIGKRVISFVPMANEWHGIHVGGTAAGSGLLNEKYRGYAPKAKIVVRPRARIWEDPASLIRDYGMVVTSNTYIGWGGCTMMGLYGDGSAVLDEQAFQFPNLLHVFAAGNSGAESNCQELGLPAGLGTVLGDYQSAKNVLSVGRTLATGIIATASSKGPTADGRIKPEIIAPGGSITSAVQNNGYQAGSGTSMATPAVTGGAALLVQRYRQLHQERNPENALVKALLCNGANDQGLPGPDYSHGFGMMNLLRSVTMLDKNQYFKGQLAHTASNTHQIVVPANTARLKVMLYWNDPAPSLLSGGATLVNNLDLTMTRPGNTTALPSFPSLSAPTAAAVAGIDSVNNMEQIVLDAPAAGTYVVNISATRIPQGVQEYFVVYDIIEPSLTVTYPLAGDRLTKGDAVNICWDSHGDALSTFNVAYSLNNGSTWTTINANVAADQRHLAWTVPDGSTSTAKVRVMRNGTALTSTSGSFAVLGVPTVTLQSVQCEGYIALQWAAVSGAADYEVMLSTGDEMRSAGITTGLKYTLASLSKDSTYYISVRARKDQVPGRRSAALIRKPDSGTCQGTISDKDLKMEAVVAPLPNVRQLTSAAYSAEQAITVRIKNLDDQPQSQPFEVGYSLGGAMHWEQVNSPVPAVGTIDYTFQQRVNLASVSDATLHVAVRLAGDPVPANDTLLVKLRQIPNPKVVLPYLQDVESVAAFNGQASTFGIPGAEQFDFTNLTGFARLRTVVPGAAYSSQRAFVLDGLVALTTSPARSYLEGTFNLSDYNTQNDEIWLSFRHPPGYFYTRADYNRLYIRGRSSDPWIYVNVLQYGGYGDVDKDFKLTLVDVTGLLRSNGQQLSSEFQARWGNEAMASYPAEGTVIDNIRLFKTTSDLAVTSVDAPSISYCEYLSSPNITAKIKNNGSDDCYAVPIKMSMDGEVIERGLAVVKKDSVVEYGFYYPIAAFQPGKHVVKIWCEKAMDVNRTNDTMQVEFFTHAPVTVAPYFENFESGNGGWYTSGTNSSWQLGTPAGTGTPGAASGQNAWKTNLNGAYNNNEESYLYSPCFQIDYSNSNFLSFSAKIDMEDCNGDACDMFYVEYNEGYGWNRLGSTMNWVNWYNHEKDWQGYWSGKVAAEWRVFSVQLPSRPYQRLRFVFKSNGSGSGQGVTIDDIHIYNNLIYNIHDGASVPFELPPDSPPGDGWTDYIYENRIVASIHPRGQDISGIRLKSFKHEGPLRVSEGQLVLDRSFVISSPTSFDTPVSVRLYLPEADIERLVTATDRPDIAKPSSVYELAITQYSGDKQDGDLANNAREGWEYFSPEKVTKVPFGRGYYLEFETRSFSEFWLAKSYIGTGTPLPVTLAAFTAEKRITEQGAAVNLRWSTASETDFSHFEVQVAAGAENLKKVSFQTLGTIAGLGTGGASQYSFLDEPVAAGGTRYYRLKMVDSDGSFMYSAVKAVTFDQDLEWKVFPNPSKGVFRLEPKGRITGRIQIEVIDQNGRLCRKLAYREAMPALEVKLDSPDLANGLYVIKVMSNEGESVFKVIKE
ncbi:S8 family serine peptidase [Dyadobacter fermentans]|uniref:Peptidase S8 and S53 subtilisin kexin sedolisin n=1 Tax=Dyadobacter fermentans (strain ATCC 700827 / DSM 18053 / CIP 107007 / KCTC 52180 / NS114) TaxID=471854 RepID=C6W1C3_DYAFD|nr:S8 family serine peptidase [Dyadobacter fermentans]ACT91980.1 peptidase S8 and S53 subtilisin kexin sedolisin [Dyadobacter fermentans DSM 18053]